MYEIIAKTHYGWEVIDTADTKKERDYLVSEYQMAYGPSIIVKSRKK
jgi:hypothetical protein